MQGVPMRGTAASHDSFNAPSQRPGTSSGRINSRGFTSLEHSPVGRRSHDTMMLSGATRSPSPTRGLPNMKELSRPVTPSAPRIVRPSRDKWPSSEYRPRPRSPGPLKSGSRLPLTGGVRCSRSGSPTRSKPGAGATSPNDPERLRPMSPMRGVTAQPNSFTPQSKGTGAGEVLVLPGNSARGASVFLDVT